MKLGIDPMIDCVFKATLGQKGQEAALVNFINAAIDLKGGKAIQAATIINPINQKEVSAKKNRWWT